MSFKQLEIYWVDLEPTRGTETQKKRPCVILQSDLVNQHSRTLIVAPILPGHKDWPFVVNVTPTKRNGIDKQRHINVKQLRAVDIIRINNRQGMLELFYKERINNALGILFQL